MGLLQALKIMRTIFKGLTVNFETYILPAHWASALINDDYTGLDDDEQLALESWSTSGNWGYCVGVEGEPEFTQWHDARPEVLPCDCLRFTFQT